MTTLCCGLYVSVSLQVCSRLSLVSLGYLWHQPQEQLLADMIDSGIHAVLVKVRQGWWALS
jgi:diphthamide synthase (EF-2-diphthine--ammonia ligase)